MSSAPNYEPILVSDYLRGELNARQKHEYVEGVVYAMVGATNVHNRISTNATIALGMQLRGKPCQVYNSDTKIRVQLSRGTRFYYPDVSIVCHPNVPSDTFHDAPAVIVEVLSESTRRTDEYEKREAYLSIGSLCVYLLVESYTSAALVYRRSDNGFERETYVDLDAIIPLPEVECELRFNDLYADVEFPPAAGNVESEEMT